MPYVVSTLSNDQEYVAYERPQASGGKVARPAVPIKSVRINGGAKVANGLRTPEGVVTSVSDQDAEFLKSNKFFQQHEKSGHLKFLAREPRNADKEVKDMSVDDGGTKGGSAPLSPDGEDFKPGGRGMGPAPAPFAKPKI